MYFLTSSLPTTLMNVALTSWARAFAINVFPQPGGPYKRTPFGGSIPTSSKSSGCLRGSSMASLNSCSCFFKPPISLYVTFGLSMTSNPSTVGSLDVGSISTTAIVL
ncbi:106aa long hypothetical protein [Pyrococcus horikoshii OT3]|uniref:Uncharacterized protein n=1 Tax=Pyrococcus horikoshii (strain ATCC 700860 / DSM 12428 / JCM 9974 / NBRC 100139 / OT-3) TaxID=70601 RepID=O57941_PYRHO|nr:106aa long hypothetical protein [Pyrococcus horikoshii OT3]